MILISLENKNLILEHVAPTGEILDTAEIPLLFEDKKDGAVICLMSNLMMDNALTDLIATLQAWRAK
jgi:hypothetical protein